MPERHYHIITSAGPLTGTGHLQRMMLLAWYLNHHTGHTATLQLHEKNPHIPEEISPFLTGGVPPQTDLIIRDMRDSTTGDIQTLRQFAPVLVIDDEGTGAGLADGRLYLLPRPGSNPPAGPGSPGFFLYGYGIYTGITPGSEPVTKDIDISIYNGNMAGDEHAAKTQQLLPPGITVGILQGSRSRIIQSGDTGKEQPADYTTLLLRSRCVLSHFGILLYEAHLCGCALLSINPTQYHSHLADITPLPVYNLGVMDTLDPSTLQSTIHTILQQDNSVPPAPSDVRQRIEKNLQQCVHWLTSLPFYR